jgi:predicted NBD/HSP70 family sugar kinase
MALRATNVSLGKQVNIWVVFETIRLHGPLSRSDLARRTSLSKPSVSSLVDELQAMGLVEDGQVRTGQMGKPSTLVQLNASGAYTIGLHLDYGRVTAILTNLIGTVRYREVWQIATQDPETTVADLLGRLDRFLLHAEVDMGRVMGLGLVMPGPFGVRGLWPTRLPDWDGTDIHRRLQSRLKLPVVLANDGTGATVAEWRFGKARGEDNFAYVFIGNGIGTGLVGGGRLYGGSNGNAGEIAHIVVKPGGHPCVCGKRGCLETYVSLESLVRFLAQRGVEISAMEDFERQMSPDHPLLALWIDQAIEPLRRGINLLENLLDPNVIFIGGDFPPWLLDRLIEQLHPLDISVRANARDDERLSRAAFGQDAAAIGAAALAMASILDPEASMSQSGEQGVNRSYSSHVRDSLADVA